MECLKLTYKPTFEPRTHESMRSREAKVVQMFISVDPLAEKYPDYTPYHYTLNNPINFVDPDGRDVYRRDGDKFIFVRLNNENEGKKDHVGVFIKQHFGKFLYKHLIVNKLSVKKLDKMLIFRIFMCEQITQNTALIRG